jgi:hypothetical protein
MKTCVRIKLFSSVALHILRTKLSRRTSSTHSCIHWWRLLTNQENIQAQGAPTFSALIQERPDFGIPRGVAEWPSALVDGAACTSSYRIPAQLLLLTMLEFRSLQRFRFRSLLRSLLMKSLLTTLSTCNYRYTKAIPNLTLCHNGGNIHDRESEVADMPYGVQIQIKAGFRGTANAHCSSNHSSKGTTSTLSLDDKRIFTA